MTSQTLHFSLLDQNGSRFTPRPSYTKWLFFSIISQTRAGLGVGQIGKLWAPRLGVGLDGQAPAPTGMCVGWMVGLVRPSQAAAPIGGCESQAAATIGGCESQTGCKVHQISMLQRNWAWEQAWWDYRGSPLLGCHSHWGA